jgi:hypothetical protein
LKETLTQTESDRKFIENEMSMPRTRGGYNINKVDAHGLKTTRIARMDAHGLKIAKNTFLYKINSIIYFILYYTYRDIISISIITAFGYVISVWFERFLKLKMNYNVMANPYIQDDQYRNIGKRRIQHQ